MQKTIGSKIEGENRSVEENNDKVIDEVIDEGQKQIKEISSFLLSDVFADILAKPLI